MFPTGLFHRTVNPSRGFAHPVQPSVRTIGAAHIVPWRAALSTPFYPDSADIPHPF